MMKQLSFIAFEAFGRLEADKGFASEEHREYLRSKKLKPRIMHKAVRGKALSKRQKRVNKMISQTRFVVERFFGTLKRKYRLERARYFGVEKVNAQMLLKGIRSNLMKAVNKI